MSPLRNHFIKTVRNQILHSSRSETALRSQWHKNASTFSVTQKNIFGKLVSESPCTDTYWFDDGFQFKPKYVAWFILHLTSTEVF
jgi:hypothetical protein